MFQFLHVCVWKLASLSWCLFVQGFLFHCRNHFQCRHFKNPNKNFGHWCLGKVDCFWGECRGEMGHWITESMIPTEAVYCLHYMADVDCNSTVHMGTYLWVGQAASSWGRHTSFRTSNWSNVHHHVVLPLSRVYSFCRQFLRLNSYFWSYCFLSNLDVFLRALITKLQVVW